MRILVTGVRGFVGGTIGRAAHDQGHTVLGVGRAAQAPAQWQAAYIPADVVTADLSRIVNDFGPDAVVHAAGPASVATSFTNPLDDLRASLLSWANLLNSVRRSGLQPLVIFPSSAAVYGEPDQLPISESDPVRPISPYGFHKAACELVAREYATCFQQHIIVCRLFSIFGAAQKRLLVWELFQQFVSNDEVVWVQGSGNETRDYISAEDLARAVLSLIDSQTTRNSSYSVVNVASGREISVIEVAKQIATVLSSKKEIRCRGIKRSGDPDRWQADVSYLQTLVPGWQARPFADALSDCVAAWRRRT